ncbi:hypothetical protein LVJ94_45330 [Pendulispora rubella]|uniref:Uncharacterized protein n=1 Tax=Pendulispora rubella TaxID=2741070 RepID=A0ABZ2KZL6_9BACT
MKVVRVLLAFVLVLLGYVRPLLAAEDSIVLQVQGSEPADRVRDAVRARLGALQVTEPASDAPPNARRLLVHVNDTVVTVTYRDEQGRETTRVVQAATKATVLDAAAILAENLVTDQTAMLLAQEEAAGKKPPPAPAPPPEKRPWHPAVVSLVYPVATNMGKPNVLTHFALDALYGHIGELDGLQVSGLGGMVEGPMHGLQIGGLGTMAGGDVDGLQIGGLGTLGKGAVNGLQIAGLAASAKEGVHGMQIAGIVGIANGGVDGLQIAPVSIAGDVHGMQLGVVNVGGKVKGTQIGVVNIADDVDGIQWGVFNYAKTSRFGAVAWASNHGFANVGIKYITKYTYTVVRGVFANERSTDFMGPGFNIGVHVPAFNPFYVDVDLGTAWMFKSGSGKAEGYDDHQARLLIGADLGGHFSLFGGGGLSVQVERKGEKNEVYFAPVFSGGIQVAY